jgi:acetyl esterase
MERLCRRLAAAGLVAVIITYPLAPAYHFPEPVHDVRDALKWLKANAQDYEVDPERVLAGGTLPVQIYFYLQD